MAERPTSHRCPLCGVGRIITAPLPAPNRTGRRLRLPGGLVAALGLIAWAFVEIRLGLYP